MRANSEQYLPQISSIDFGSELMRPRAQHVSFATGAHACLGMGLARLELEVALLALLERFPRLRLDPGHPPRRGCETLFFRGFEALPTVTA
jgi:cytochrome P450